MVSRRSLLATLGLSLSTAATIATAEAATKKKLKPTAKTAPHIAKPKHAAATPTPAATAPTTQG